MKFATFVHVVRAILLVVLFFAYPSFAGWQGDQRGYAQTFFLAVCVCVIMILGRGQKVVDPEQPIPRKVPDDQ